MSLSASAGTSHDRELDTLQSSLFHSWTGLVVKKILLLAHIGFLLSPSVPIYGP